MVGMFGGVKRGGGGKLVMGEICSIRIIKLMHCNFVTLPSVRLPELRLPKTPRGHLAIFTRLLSTHPNNASKHSSHTHHTTHPGSIGTHAW